MDAYAVKYAGNGLSLLFNQMTQYNDYPIEFIDPFCTIFKLAILNYKADGTKISIKNNSISIQDNWMLQGLQRWYNNDERDQLHQLKLPIFYFRGVVLQLITFNFLNLNQDLLNYINDLAIKGLKKMKVTYDNDRKNGSLVKNCIDDYIKILSTSYTGEDYESEMFNIAKPTLFAIYHEYAKMWTEYDFKILKKLFNLVDLEDNAKIKNKLADAIDQFISAKDLKIDTIRPD